MVWSDFALKNNAKMIPFFKTMNFYYLHQSNIWYGQPSPLKELLSSGPFQAAWEMVAISLARRVLCIESHWSLGETNEKWKRFHDVPFKDVHLHHLTFCDPNWAPLHLQPPHPRCLCLKHRRGQTTQIVLHSSSIGVREEGIAWVV